MTGVETTMSEATLQTWDVAVIGAGPGGYTAAIRAAQLGMRTVCIDGGTGPAGEPAPGGTCTNTGCIPSKALLQSSEYFDHAGHGLADHGIVCGPPTLDLARMMARKDAVVRQNNDGIRYLLRKNQIEFLFGRAKLRPRVESASNVASESAFESASDAASDTANGEAPVEIVVEPDGRVLRARHVILATGSSPRPLAGAAFDEQHILSNRGALMLDAVPRRLGIIGAGVIGLELGSVWRRLGAQVTVLEAQPNFLGMVDEQIAREARKAFRKQGLDLRLGVEIGAVVSGNAGITVMYRGGEGGGEGGEGGAAVQGEETLECDRLIVAIGRVPNSGGWGADAVGLAVDDRGFVVVDEGCRTNLAGVWAIGDLVRGPMLAHKAEEEAVAVAEQIAGRTGHVDLDRIPGVVYTDPEIAWVGQTEAQLRAAGRAIRVGTFPFSANGRARAAGNTVGLVKILADEASDEILGVHILGAGASELIAEAVVAMAFRASSEDLARICHAHPTRSEALHEAALAVDGRALNF